MVGEMPAFIHKVHTGGICWYVQAFTSICRCFGMYWKLRDSGTEYCYCHKVNTCHSIVTISKCQQRRYMDIYFGTILFCRKIDLIKYLGKIKNRFDKCHFYNQQRVARIPLLIEHASK